MYTDHYPNMTIHDCLTCLEEDFTLLQDETWLPDEDSCQASLDMVESIRAKLHKQMNKGVATV